MILLTISFIAGLLTVLAPCILPVLPIIIGGSLDNRVNIKKALTVVASLSLSVIAFTLLLKASTLFINIPSVVWTWVSGLIIIALGLIMIFPNIWEGKLLARLNSRSNILLGKGNQKQSFWGDVIVGVALGPVFSTCSPTYFIVLATVLPAQPLLGLTYLFAYVVGLSLALFVIAILGQKIMAILGVVSDPRGLFKKVLGVLFIIVGILVIGGLDKKLQVTLLNAGFFDITKVEQSLLLLNEKPNTSNLDVTPVATGTIDKPIPQIKQPEYKSVLKKNNLTPAPEISTPDGFINTNGQPITLQEFRGKKVVLLDIWTYSCINCQRTLPYLKEWDRKYRDQGLVIIGLHTPEFAFERVLANVEKAVKDFGLEYPVVLDNDYSTWKALGNNFWPRKYLINLDGNIVYDHIGEGFYDETERAIQEALKVAVDISTPQDAPAFSPVKIGSPEIYFGSARSNSRALGVAVLGEWKYSPEYAETVGEASILYNYSARDVYMVASASKSILVEVFVDGKLNKTLTIQEEKLYHLVEGAEYGGHKLELKIKNSGLKVFTFTFG